MQHAIWSGIELGIVHDEAALVAIRAMIFEGADRLARKLGQVPRRPPPSTLRSSTTDDLRGWIHRLAGRASALDDPRTFIGYLKTVESRIDELEAEEYSSSASSQSVDDQSIERVDPETAEELFDHPPDHPEVGHLFLWAEPKYEVELEGGALQDYARTHAEAWELDLPAGPVSHSMRQSQDPFRGLEDELRGIERDISWDLRDQKGVQDLTNFTHFLAQETRDQPGTRIEFAQFISRANAALADAGNTDTKGVEARVAAAGAEIRGEGRSFHRVTVAIFEAVKRVCCPWPFCVD